MKVSFTFLLSLLYSFLSAQGDFTITGKIERLTKSNSVIVGSSWGTFTGEIKNDGSFKIMGKVASSGTALIYTDSSGADAIWLEAGTYNISCNEIIGGTNYVFRTSELKGPKDAEIFYKFSEPWYYIKGKTTEDTKEKLKLFCSTYVDSIFKTNSSTSALPEILRRSQGIIDDEKIKKCLSLLDENQSKDISAVLINDFYKRKDKIEKEKYFQYFQMQDQNGKIFKLSSLNNKLILLDFWASDCYPCRRKHPKLAELYKKYKDKGFEIISVSLDDNKTNWEKAILKDEMSWINVSEFKGWNTSLVVNYFIHPIPFSIWLDKDKKIISITDLSENQIEEYLK